MEEFYIPIPYWNKVKRQFNGVAPTHLLEAQTLYYDLKYGGTKWGRTQPHAFSAACIYIAQRQAKEPYTIREILDYTASPYERSIRNIIIAYRKRIHPAKLPPVTHNSYLSRFCNKLGISEFNTNAIVEAGKHITGGSSSPAILAGSIIYYTLMQLGSPLTQRVVAEAVVVTEVSIRKTYRKYADQIENAYEVVNPYHETQPVKDLDVLVRKQMGTGRSDRK